MPPPNKSIRDFFKPKQSNSDPPSSAGPSSSVTKSQSLPPPCQSLAQKPMGLSSSRRTSKSESFKSSSLSPPPSSDASAGYHTPRERPEHDTPITASSSTAPAVPQNKSNLPEEDTHGSSPSPQENETFAPVVPRSRDAVIHDSDDDSDESLQDLGTIFGRKPLAQKPSNSPAKTPSTPHMSRYINAGDFHSSPLTVQPKYRFDLKTLAKHREDEDSLEISSKRVKSMLKPTNTEDIAMGSGESSETGLLARDALITSVMADGDSGEAHKVKRALLRTEATLPDKCWYFFEPTSDTVELPDNKFPVASVSEVWENELTDPDMRELSFTSGFVEDLVVLGKALPDELLMWMLDELCWEPSDPLRTSYMNVLLQSSDQVHRLVNHEIIQKLFQNLGAQEKGVSVTTIIALVNKLDDPYPDCQWECLHTVIRFLGKIAHIMKQDTRIYAMIMLLRMGADRMVNENVDILVEAQKSIHRLCKYTSEESREAWEQACKQIVTSLYTTIRPPGLRLQILNSIPSTSTLSHDLRRRLAMCFFFCSLDYASAHSHTLMSLDPFMARLESPIFDTGPETDYRELASYISLLDIAIDDGRPIDLDLTSKPIERKFNEDVEYLSTMVKDIMRNIGNPGAAFISKIEAKEKLDLLSQRIGDGMRTRPKVKKSLFDGIRKEEDLEREKAGMQSFVNKMKAFGNRE